MGALGKLFGSMVLAGALGSSGCGGSVAQPRVISEFTPSDAALFDDGVDFVENALVLEGRWRDEWHADLEGRAARADVVAVVEARALQTDTGPDGQRTYRIAVAPLRVLAGQLADRELMLISRPASPGYRTLQGNPHRLESGRFVAFLKWYRTPEQEEAVHWHLAPASEDLIAAVSRMLGGSGTQGTTTFVHQHD